MRAPGRLPLIVLLGVAVLVLCGCTVDGATDPSAVPSRVRLGGQVPATVDPPREAMSGVEKAVAGRLAQHLDRDGLTLQHLDCPTWDTTLPRRMTCRGYVDGLVARVRVDLIASAERHVRFDARLTDGVVAVAKLERTLRSQGWSAAACGDVAAYPARRGSRIRCRVTRSGRDRYVLATVEDRLGGVRIAVDRSVPVG